jgi:hypothetical protein
LYKYYIPDAYLRSQSRGNTQSHESVCVLNTSCQAANLSMVMYFQDQDKLGGFHRVIEPERTLHIRVDHLKNAEGTTVPKDKPYAIVVESDIPVMVQYTRVDTSQPELALMTTMVYAEQS